MVVGDSGKVGIFKVVNILTESLFYLLLDERINHGVRFSAARRAQYDGSTERIHNVNPAVVPLLPVIETGGQVNGILVFKQACFLHERLILLIEHVIHQVVLQQATHVKSRHEQADIADRHREHVQGGVPLHTEREGKHPPVEEEEHEPHAHERPYFRPRDFFLFHARSAQTGKCEQQDGKQLGIDDAPEQPCRAVEVHQDSIDHADVHFP